MRFVVITSLSFGASAALMVAAGPRFPKLSRFVP